MSTDITMFRVHCSRSADVALVSKAMHKEKKNEGDDGVTQAQLKVGRTRPMAVLAALVLLYVTRPIV